MIKFEIVSKYSDAELSLPERKTRASAGYDFQVAEDIVIPSYKSLSRDLDLAHFPWSLKEGREACTLEEVAKFTKETGAKPTLVPTGIKCAIPNDMYLELSIRSSCPLKYWLFLANGNGIIDADYYNNPDNEGHIFFQIINLAPFPILKKYYTTDDDAACGERTGGFGSTNKKFVVNTIIDATVYDKYGKCGTIKNIKPMEEECAMACNPERRAYVFGAPKEPTHE